MKISAARNIINKNKGRKNIQIGLIHLQQTDLSAGR